MFKNIHLNKKTVLITAGIICGVLAAIYIGFSVFFMNHFFFRTTINGMPVAGCTADKVEKNAEESVKGYALDIAERDGKSETISGDDFGLKAESDGNMEKLLKKQNGFAWIVKLFKPDHLTSETLVSYDEDKLKSVADDLDCMMKRIKKSRSMPEFQSMMQKTDSRSKRNRKVLQLIRTKRLQLLRML